MRGGDWPDEARVFDGEFSLVDGDFHSADGFGRIWIMPVGNRLPQEFVLKLGSEKLRIAAISQTVGTELFGFAGSDKGWVANVSQTRDGNIQLSLYGIGQFHKSRELDMRFTSLVEGEDEFSFDNQCRTIDTWTGRDLLLLRFNSEDEALFLVGAGQVGKVQVNTDVAEITSLHSSCNWGQVGRWILLDTEPLNTAVGHWDEASILFLQGINNSMSDFMDAWKQYNDAEEREIEELHARVGNLQYGKLDKIVEGTEYSLFSVTVSKGNVSSAGLAFLKERIDTGGQVVLEVSQEQPSIDRESRNSKIRNLRVEVEHVDDTRGTIQFRVPIYASEVPKSGFLFVSVAGDLAQVNRRRLAESRFASGACELKGLSEILREATPFESRRRKQEVGVSAKLRSGFNGRLTERQTQAIDLAINTPDIALIQGPPGTGKTQVIALIEERLAELAENGVKSSLILLTSTQNDAVDQVAARTRIFGLPPARDVGHRGIDPIDVWRKERLGAAYSLLDSDAKHNYVTTVKNLVLKICEDNFTFYEQFDLLSELETHAIDERTREMTISARRQLEQNQLKKSLREKLERRIRALRTSSASFADDGHERLIDVQNVIELPGVPMEWSNRFRGQIRKILSEKNNAWKLSSDLQGNMLDLFASAIDDRPKPFDKETQATARYVSQQVEKNARYVKDGADLSIGEALELYVNEISTFPAVDAVVRRYTAVHAATCQRSALYLDRVRFQNVIVDEAARVNPTDLLIPLVQATTRVILVGDHRQLPATFDENIARGVSESDLLQTSLFERLFVLLQKVGHSTGIPRTVTLNTQYRMHPRLGDFVSKHFYEPYGETLENGLPEERFQHRIPGFESRTSVWVDIPLERGSAQRAPSRSWFREVEAIEVARIASQVVRENPDLSVGVITFYSAQKNLILENLDEEHVMRDELGRLRVADEYSLLTDSSGKSHERLRIGSVDAFQGKEFDVVILSLVRSQKIRSSDSARELYGFAAVENRMCVALSRQKKLLIVVGDKAMAASENARDVTGLHGLVKLCDLEEEELNGGLVG